MLAFFGHLGVTFLRTYETCGREGRATVDSEQTVQRIGAVAEVPAVLRAFGHDPGAVLRERAGFDAARLRDPEGQMTMAEVLRVLAAGVAATGCGHFGLLVGLRSGTAHLGPTGRLMRNAPTLGEALLDICQHQRRYIRGAVTYLIVQEGMAHWGYGIHHPGLPDTSQGCEVAVGISLGILRELVGAAPTMYQMARRTPPDGAAFRKALGTTVEFDATQYAAVFPAGWLDRPVPGADKVLRGILLRQIANYRPAGTAGVAEQVTRILHARATLGETRLEEVAETLDLHPRALNRRLNAEGTNFRALREKARHLVASQLLLSTRLPVTEIALALGYSELSSFTHAFQRWAGVAPVRWRETAGGGEVAPPPT